VSFWRTLIRRKAVEITSAAVVRDPRTPGKAAPPARTTEIANPIPRRHDSATPGSTFRPGDLVSGRFRIVRFIARGGMGELYEAEDLELEEKVALKTIRPEIAADHRVNQRFRREVQLARKITHPGICRIFDLFQHQPVPREGGVPPPVFFVTMELLDGETLAELLQREGPLTLERAVPIALQMAGALAAAHSVGIVHRDFKSNNVMVLRTQSAADPPRVVVTDFGLAYSPSDMQLGSGASISVAGEILGTPEYMAPEQIQGDAVTPATDVYALGIVLYETVTGVRPFDPVTSLASVMRRVSGPPPRPPRELNRDIPAVWDGVITRCLNSAPADRFVDAAAVMAALRGDGGARRLPSRRALAASVVGLLLLVAGGALSWLEWGPKPQGATPTMTEAVERVRPSVAVLGFRNLTGREDTEWVSLALAEMLTTELTGTEALRSVPGETIDRMKTELALAAVDSFSPETLARIRANVGADYVVSGSYVAVGEGSGMTIRLDIRVQDSRDGRTAAAFGESGSETDLVDLVAKVGERLLEQLGIEAMPGALASIRASAPTSAEATRLYTQGLMHLRGFDPIAARASLERAIQADAEFPLAHSALADTWSALGYDERARQSAERAFELSGKLSRIDRLQVEGTYREMARSWQEAIVVWQTLVDLYPDDIEHTLRLANAQISSGAANDGLSTIESFRKRFPATQDPRLDLTSAAAAETLSDFKRMETLAAAAAAVGESQGASLLVATAKWRQGTALLRQGRTDEGTRLTEEARELYGAAGDRAGVARALNSLGAALSEGPDPRRSLTLYEEGLAIARAVGNQDLVARFLNNMAIQYRRAGDLQASLRMNQESLAIRRETGDRTNEATSLNNIGNVLLDLGDLEGASEHYEQSAAMSREIGDRRGLARVLNNAAEALQLQGRLPRARERSEEALEIRRSIDDPASVGSSLVNLANILMLQGDLVAAQQLFAEALDIHRRLMNARSIAYTLQYAGDLALVQGDLAGAERQHQEALELRTQVGEKVTAAGSRVALATIALEQGRAMAAESLAREAVAVFAELQTAEDEAVARSTLALALLVQGGRDSARREVERAQALLLDTQYVPARMSVAIAAAQIGAADDRTSALRELEAVRAEAVERGMPRYELEARRAMAEIEGLDSPAGAARKASLQRDAKQRGFTLYSR